MAAIAAANLGAWRRLSDWQSGLLRSYVAVAAVGVVVIVLFVVLR